MADVSSSGVVNLKVRRRGRAVGKNRIAGAQRLGRKHDLVPIADNSGPARFFRRMVKDIESDLGGRRFLTRIEGELIRAFAGSATMLQVQNVAIALGDSSEIDPTAYATMASTMLRIGSRLGLSRRMQDATPTLEQYIENQEEEHDAEQGQEGDAESIA